VVKRLVDVVFAAVLLLLALPVLLLAAVWIRVSSPGPVLFRQVRMGRGVRPFHILKLRTMAHAEAGLAYTLGPDPRITRFGKWLRRTKVDELPQLWNVLRGEMSLVGPRPVIPELVLEFNVEYSDLLLVRPGLTDPASLKYSQETRLLAMAADPLDFFKRVVTPDKIRISLRYIQRANLWTDLQTMAMTGAVCCVPALSRLYGRMPDATVGLAASRNDSFPGIALVPFPQTESLFMPEVAYSASVVEEVPQMAAVPWNLLQMPDIVARSTVARARGSGSSL